MTPRVFISSRLRELEEERVAVEGAVKKLLNNDGIVYKTWMWEAASKERPSGNAPDGVQSKELKNSDVYLLILGAEYGPEEGISSTHKEYEEAHFEFDNDCILVYVKNDESTVKKREKRLKKWLERIAGEITYKGFEDTKDLKAHVEDKLRALWNAKFKEKEEGFEKIAIPEKFKGENVLGKKGDSEPEIFRHKGPLWIDFQSGMVDTGAFQLLLTKQGKELRFDDLFINHSVILLAPPASGKSVLLRYICYKLCTMKKSVYFVELKRDKNQIAEIIDFAKADWPQLEEEVYFLVDDVHLDPEDSIDIFNWLCRPCYPKCYVIMAGRDTSNLNELRDKFEEMDGLEIQLNANVLAKSILQHFVKIREQEIRYEDVSSYAADLWVFAFALEAFAGAKGKADERGIFEYIYKQALGYHEKAPCILLALADFYVFELPVDEFAFKKILLKNKLGRFLKDDYDALLSILTEKGLVFREMGYLRLPHSSLANLYIQTSSKISFGSQIMDHFWRFGNKWQENLIRQYLLSEPDNLGDFAIAFGDARYYDDNLAQAIMESPELDPIWIKAIQDIKIRESFKRRKSIGWSSLIIRQIGRFDLERAKQIAEQLPYDWVYGEFIKEVEEIENELHGLTILRFIGTYPRLEEIISDEKFIEVTTAKIRNIGDFNLQIAIFIIALKLSQCERDILDRYVSAVNMPDMTQLKDLFNRMETLTDKVMVVAAAHILNNELGEVLYYDVKKCFEDDVKQNCEDKSIFNDVGKAIFYIATFDQDFAEKVINQVNPKSMQNDMRRYVSEIYIPGISTLTLYSKANR
jgi:hypothetical protein